MSCQNLATDPDRHHPRRLQGHPTLLLPIPEPVATLGTSCYFSVVTFTTLGYGDLQPATGIAQAIATVESLVGAFLLALLVYVLGRRATI